MTNRSPGILCLLFALCCCSLLYGQELKPRSFLEPADTFHRGRFWTMAGTGTVLYATAFTGLYEAWYKNYELGGFRTFNDAGEWMHMDKIGHSMTTYAESYLIFHMARWTGMPRRSAMWTGAGAAMLLQTTIEVMDGFSVKWGFSWADMAYNAAGAGLFIGQEMLWEEQRIWMKVSNTRPTYPGYPVYSVDGGAVSTLRTRAHDLFGASFGEAFIKDYNGQTLWLSVNPSAFILPNHHDNKFPRWLNLAVGYGAQNMYGGYANSWTDDAGNRFVYNDPLHPRYHQFYLSLDVDLTRIRTDSRFLKVLLGALNWIKIPAPTLEVNTKGGVIFHPLYW